MAAVFVCHPYAVDPRRNRKIVVTIARQLAIQGHVPLAPQIFLPALLDEVTERERALDICLKLVALSDQLRVYGEPTAGMLLEIAEARRLGIAIVAGDAQARKALTGEPPR